MKTLKNLFFGILLFIAAVIALAYAFNYQHLFNAIALTGFALVFFTNYAFIMGLPSYRNFTYMSPAVMWLILVGLGISQFIATSKLSVKSTRYSGIILMISSVVASAAAKTTKTTIERELIWTAFLINNMNKIN